MLTRHLRRGILVGVRGSHPHTSETTNTPDRRIALLAARRVPITTPPRTLLDLSATLEPSALRPAVRQAEVLRLVTMTSLEEQLARSGAGRRGASRLLAIVEPGRRRREASSKTARWTSPAGYRVLRLTWQQVVSDEPRTIERLRLALETEEPLGRTRPVRPRGTS